MRPALLAVVLFPAGCPSAPPEQEGRDGSVAVAEAEGLAPEEAARTCLAGWWQTTGTRCDYLIGCAPDAEDRPTECDLPDCQPLYVQGFGEEGWHLCAALAFSEAERRFSAVSPVREGTYRIEGERVIFEGGTEGYRVRCATEEGEEWLHLDGIPSGRRPDAAFARALEEARATEMWRSVSY